MIGKLLSSAVKIATIPVDAIESTIDVATGGDGSQLSRDGKVDLLSKIRDGVCESLEDIDK
mgnify:CR=1 FL=1